MHFNDVLLIFPKHKITYILHLLRILILRKSWGKILQREDEPSIIYSKEYYGRINVKLYKYKNIIGTSRMKSHSIIKALKRLKCEELIVPAMLCKAISQ